MGPIGAQEMIFIVLLALLLFGPKKLPELGRLLGKGLTEFRRAKNELTSTFESHMRELDKEARIAEQAEAAKRNPSSSNSVSSSVNSQEYSSATYPYPYDEYGRESSSPSEIIPTAAPVEPSPSHGEPVAGTVPRTSSNVVPQSHTEESVHSIAEENRPA